MKKLTLALLAIVCLLFLWACAPQAPAPNPTPSQPQQPNPDPTPNQPDKPEQPEDPEQPSVAKGVAVVYFSATNTTKKIAEGIAQVTDATLWRIEPTEPYTAADLNYIDDGCRANSEQNDPSARPQFVGSVDLSQCDTVFLGYPIWWGTLPKIICTFLDAYDLSGKTVVPFCTSGGSGIATSVSAIRAAEPNTTVKEGMRFASNATQQTIEAWAKQQLPQQEITVKIYCNNKVLEMTLTDNSSARAFAEKLKQGDVTVTVSDYGNFEKVGELGFSLPRNDENITTSAGDVILYLGSNICLYYGTNTYNFTRLGKIAGMTRQSMLEFLGEGTVTVTFSLK